MQDKTRKIIIGFLVIIIIITAGYLGIKVAKKFNDNQVIAEGIILTKKSDLSYEGKLITNYQEYTDLLKEYNVSNQVFLTSGAFSENDYIVDFIYYKDSLKIFDIDLNINEEGIEIIYFVNKKVDSSENYLMYFIPIEKGTISEVKIKNREFKVK